MKTRPALLPGFLVLLVVTMGGWTPADAARDSGYGSHMSRYAFGGAHLGESFTMAARHFGVRVRHECGAPYFDLGDVNGVSFTNQGNTGSRVQVIDSLDPRVTGPAGLRIGMTLAQAKARMGHGVHRFDADSSYIPYWKVSSHHRVVFVNTLSGSVTDVGIAASRNSFLNYAGYEGC